jgi:hypothetical protein
MVPVPPAQPAAIKPPLANEAEPDEPSPVTDRLPSLPEPIPKIAPTPPEKLPVTDEKPLPAPLASMDSAPNSPEKPTII